LVANASGWGGDGTAGRLDQVSSDTGTHWLREEFLWSRIEPQHGQFDFSYYDHFMLLAAQNDFHVLPLLDDTPSWAGPNWNTIPSDPSDYAAYVAAVVKRYGPGGSFWSAHPELSSTAAPNTYELWNEPYQPGGNDNTYDPGRYARLVKAATTAGRDANPHTKYLLADEVTGQQVGSTWVPWIDALYQAVPDLNKYFDAVAIHPYGTDVTSLKAPGFGQLRRTELLRSALVSHGAADKPLWITEVGWSTCSHGSLCVSTTQQATNTTQLFHYLHTTWAPYVKAVFLYNYQDISNDNTSSFDNYGLTTTNDTPKPALTIYKAQAALTSMVS